MNTEPRENDLRSLFEQQRRLDAARTPSFERLAIGRRFEPRQPAWPRLTSAAATAAVLMAAAFFLLHRSPEPARIDREAVAEVMQWEASTTFLLEPVWQTASASNQPLPTHLQP